MLLAIQLPLNHYIGINGVRDNQNVAPHNMILHTYVYENKVNDEKIIDVDKSMMVEKEGKYYLNSDFNNLCGTLNTISVETFYYTLSDLDGKKVYADYIHVEDNWSVLNIPLLYGENRIELVAIKDNEIVEKYDIILINDDISKMNSINSFLPDSDDDGINDYLEMIYGTDPINSDTDGDGLLDGEEEELGMDPTKYDSNDNGISDGEESIPQIIKEGRYASTLYEDNMAIPSLSEVIAKGNINNSIRISEYNDYLKGDERAYVGKAIEIKKANISSATLSFTISESYEVKDYVIAGTKTNGLLICYNDYENTVPLDTVFDEKLRTVSAEITSDGIYFVVDAIDWIGSLGIDINSIVTSVEKVEDLTINENEFSDLKRMDSRTAENKTELSAVGDIIERKNPEVLCEAKDNNVKISEKTGNEEPTIAEIKIHGQVDIIFVVDTTGSMGSYINNVKKNLSEFADDLKNAGISPNYALVNYEDITYDGKDSTKITKNGVSNWFKDVVSFKKAIDGLKLGDGGDTLETAIDGLEMARQLDMRPSAQKFVILITDAGYKINNNYGITSMGEITEMFKNQGINVSVVTKSSCEKQYRDLYTNTNGIYANIYGDFRKELLSISNMIGEDTNDGYWIALNGLIPIIVKLDEKPSLLSRADTDCDSLLDREELKSVNPSKYLDVSMYTSLLGLDIPNTVIPVYNYYTNPAKEDSDGDGYLDGKSRIINGIEFAKDPRPLHYEAIPYIDELCNLAQEYQKNFKKSQKLVIDYLRSGIYDDDKYAGSGNWENTAGKVDKKFIEYVNNKNPEMKKYLYATGLEDVKYIMDPNSGNVIDFTHLTATFGAFLYNTSAIKMFLGDKLPFAGIPYYTENNIDNLAGWAGDLQTLIQTDLLIWYDSNGGDHYFSETVLDMYSEDDYRVLVKQLLADNSADSIKLNGLPIHNSRFGISDQLADIDAVNAYYSCYQFEETATIGDCLKEYYHDEVNRYNRSYYRFDYFIDHLLMMCDDDYSYGTKYCEYDVEYLKNEISRNDFKSKVIDLFTEFVYIYTNEKCPDGEKWTLYKSAPVTEAVSKGAARAFAEYIVGKWRY